MRFFTVDLDFDGLRNKKYKIADFSIKEKRKVRDREKKRIMEKLF